MAEMSFLPEDYLERRAQRRTNVMSLVLFVVVMGFIVGAYFITDRERDDVRRQQSQVNGQFEDAARRLEQLDQLQARKDQMIHKAKVTAVLLERIPRSLVLAELINNMPATLSLLEFELKTRATKAPATARTALDKLKKQRQKLEEAGPGNEPRIAPTETSIEMVGVAPTDVQVAQFMSALGRSELFRDVSLSVSEQMTIDERPMRRFRIEMKLQQDADVETLKPRLVEGGLRQDPMSNTIQIDGSGRLVVPGAPLSHVEPARD